MSDTRLTLFLHIDWPEDDEAATRALLAYASECAAELGLPEEEDPTEVPEALAVVITAHGFDGLRSGSADGRVAPDAYNGYVVTTTAQENATT